MFSEEVKQFVKKEKLPDDTLSVLVYRINLAKEYLDNKGEKYKIKTGLITYPDEGDTNIKIQFFVDRDLRYIYDTIEGYVFNIFGQMDINTLHKLVIKFEPMGMYNDSDAWYEGGVISV